MIHKIQQHKTTKFMKKIFLLIIICLFIIETNGQDGISMRKKVYNLNYKIEFPLIGGLYALNFYGFSQLNKKPTLDTFQIFSLNKNDALNKVIPELTFTLQKNSLITGDLECLLI